MGSGTKMTGKVPLIVIDARMIGAFGHGIAEYVRDLVEGLRERSSTQYQIHLLIGKELSSKDPIRKVSHTLVQAPFLSPLEWLEVPWVLRKLKASLFHSPSFSAFPFLSVPTVYTVHDLIHLHFGTPLQKLYYHRILKPALNQAAQLTTVSQFSRKELGDWLGCGLEKIEVIPNVIHLESLPTDWEKRLEIFRLKKQAFHFSLSSSKPHKNIDLLARAYLSHVQRNPEAWPLVLSVPPAELKIQHPKLICLGALNSEDKNALLAGAGAFYFPSLLEGFGRPPLEAYHSGCRRVNVSDIPVHRELFSDWDFSPMFLDPRNEQVWSEQFLREETLSPDERGQSAVNRPRLVWDRLQLAQEFESIYLKACQARD